MDKWILSGLLVAMLAGSHALSYKYGSLVGANEVSAAWADANEIRRKADDKFQKENAALMAAHLVRQQDLENELALSNARYENELSRYSSEFASRLQQSEQRAGVYSRKARSTEAERDDLARHAARLDQALEEGRALVRELWTTLRQREVTIRALGGIILNDRTLLESDNVQHSQ